MRYLVFILGILLVSCFIQPTQYSPIKDIIKRFVIISTERGYGSGVILSSKLILTAHHILNGTKKATIYSAFGNFEIDVNLVLDDTTYDVSILKIDIEQIKIKKVSTAKALNLLDEVYYIQPFLLVNDNTDLEIYFMSAKIASAEFDSNRNVIFYKLDRQSFPGVSGSGVFVIRDNFDILVGYITDVEHYLTEGYDAAFGTFRPINEKISKILKEVK